MNILQINTADNRGGAAKVAYGLKSELEKLGHQTSMFVGKKDSQDENVFVLNDKKSFCQRIRKKLSYYLANDIDLFSSDKIVKTEQFKRANIVHCHNLHSYYFNLNTLKKISRLKPVVWTFHDMWPITAHCGHSFGNEVKNGFFQCPSVEIFPPIKWHNEKYLENKKRKIYENSKFHIVVPSLWLKRKVEKSILGKKPISLIYNGVNTEVFKPYNKNESRKKFNLPLNKKLVLFVTKGAQSNPWKGGEFVDLVIENFKRDKNVFFVNIGGHSLTKESNIWHLPYVEERSILAQYYSSADFLLYPTLADTFSLVTAEAMACGLPVLTFNTGALPELVTHGENGYIADYENLEDLLNGAQQLLNLNPLEKEKYSALSRSLALNKFDFKIMVSNYLKLYENEVEIFRQS